MRISLGSQSIEMLLLTALCMFFMERTISQSSVTTARDSIILKIFAPPIKCVLSLGTAGQNTTPRENTRFLLDDSPKTEVTTSTTLSVSWVKPSNSYSASKRGVAYNNSLVSLFSSYSQVTWAYNWADIARNTPQGFEYVPMLWGLG